MKQIDLTSWEQFEDQVLQLTRERSEIRGKKGVYVSDYLFRGQPNCSWHLTTTLERQASGPLTLDNYYRTVCATKPQVETFTGARWEIPSYSDYKDWASKTELFPPSEFLAYEYFVYLRHHGFPSPLLDWTRSPYVAAYFAFRDLRTEDEMVSIFAYCEYTTGHKSWSSDSPLISVLGPYVRSHRRHFQQQSQYTICTIRAADKITYACHEDVFTKNDQDQDVLWKFNIPASERRKALARLEQYNINAFSLFGSEESLMETLSIREILLKNDSFRG
jgi:hypothetical protein